MRRTVELFLLIGIAAGLWASDAWAVSRDWNGGVGDWYDANNWTPYGAPASNDILNVASGQATLTTAPDLTINGGGAINLSGTGEINRSTTHWTRVGDTTAGTFNQTGGTASLAGNLVVGINNGSGAYNLSAGQLTVTGTDTYIAYGASTSSGSFVQTDGAFANSGWLNVGAANGGNGHFDISGGGVTTGTLAVGREGYGTMSISQAAGKTTTVTTNGFYLGYYAAAAGSSMTISGGTLNINGAAYFGREAAVTFTQTGGTVNGPNTDLFVGYGAADGTLTVNGGLFSQTGGNFRVGVDNSGSGKGTFNLISGDVDLRYLSVAQGNVNSQGYVNVSGGTLDIAAEFRVGLGGTGAYTQNGGTVIAAGGGDHFIGLTSGSGTVTVNNGTLRHTAGNTRVGADTTGTLNINGGTVQLNYLSLAQGNANSKGYATMTGGTLDVNQQLRVAVSDGTTAVFTQTGGSVGSIAARPLLVAQGANSSGLYDLQGGSLTLGNGASYVGYGAGSTGTLNVAGGTLYDASGSDFIVGNGTAVGNLTVTSGSFSRPNGNTIVGASNSGAGQGNMTISGTGDVNLLWLSIGQFSGSANGVVTMTGGTLDVVTYLRAGVDGSGTFTQSGGLVGGTTPTKVQVAAAGGSTGTYNLDGGTLVTPSIASAGNGTFNFNGGTLRASAATGNWMQVTNAYVKAGGAVIDTNGFDATVAQVLQHDPALGATPDGGLTKQGAGTLTLTGANTFTGSVTVNGGTLKMGNMTAFGDRVTAVTKVVVAPGATVDLNGVWDATYGYTIAGTGAAGTGALVNTGGNIGNGNAQMSNLRLSADATIGGTGNFALLTWGYGATTLDLAGFTLTKAGTNTFTVANTTFTAGTIRIAGGTFSQFSRAHDAGAVAFTLDNTAGANLALGGLDLAIGSLAGGGTTGGTVDLGGNRLTVGALGTSTTYAGVISGGGGLAKVGNGTLTLNGASSFTGSVLVNAGTLKIGNRNALGAANTAVTKVVVAPGGAVDFNGVWDATYGYTIAGTGAAGTGALVNTGGNIGNNYAQSSNITLSADATIGGTGNFALLASGYGPTTLDLAGFTLTKAGTNTFTVANATLTAGTIHIAGGTFSQSVRAHDAGAVAFTLDNTAGANLALGGFDLTVGSLAGGGTTGGSVDLGANRLTVGALGTSTNYAGVISGGGGLTKVGAGTLTLSGASSFTGSVLVNGGTLKIGNMYAFGARNASATKVIVASGATVDFNGVVDAGYGYTIVGTGASGTGALVNTGGNIGNGNLQSSNITLSADAMIGGTGNFALLAPGYAPTTLDLAGFTLTKAGTNTFTVANATLTAGTIRIAGGTFSQYTRAHDAGAVAFTLDNTAGANLALGGYDLAIGSLAGGGTAGGSVNLGGNRLTVGAVGTSTTYAGVISGTGGLTKTGAGTLELTGASAYSGLTTVGEGTLRVNNTAGSATGTGAVQIDRGTLAGSGFISGPVTVGDVPVGPTAIDSYLAPGNSPGILSTGSLTMNSDAMLLAELWGPIAGDPINGYDQVDVTGGVTLNGPSLDLDLQFAPALGDQFVLIQNDASDAVSGTFVTPEGPLAEGSIVRDVFNGYSYPFALSYMGGTGNDVVLTAVPEPSTMLLSLLGLAGLAWLRRRRVRSLRNRPGSCDAAGRVRI